LDATCFVIIALIEHQVPDNPLGGEIMSGEFQCNFTLPWANHPRVDFPVQGFPACPYFEIQNDRSLPWWKLTFAQYNGNTCAADILRITVAAICTRMGYFDIDLNLIAFCCSFFHFSFNLWQIL